MKLTPDQWKALGVGTLIGGGVTLLAGAIWRYCSSSPKRRDVYQSLSTVKDFKPTSEELVAWAQSPGGRTVNDFSFRDLTPEQLLAVSNRLHQVLGAKDVWAWQPSVKTGGQFRALLDGVCKGGECAVPVSALQVLLTGRTPFGLGQDGDSLKTTKYEGAHGNGFISRHAGTVLGLEGNVYNRMSAPTGYYLWGNHKVLEYEYGSSVKKKVFVDPNYSTSQGGDGSYATLDAMAVAQLSGTDVDFDEADFAPFWVREVSMTDDNAPSGLKGFYITCCIVDGRKTLATDEEVNNAIRDKKPIRVIANGPFDLGSDGKVANCFNFQKGKNYLTGFELD